MKSSIPIRGVGNKLTTTSEFAIVKLHLNGLSNGQVATGELTVEVHLIDQLKAEMLVGTDVISPERIVMDLHRGQMVIGSCRDLVINIDSKARLHPNTRRTIRATKSTVLPPGRTTSVPVAFNGGVLPDDRDFRLTDLDTTDKHFGCHYCYGVFTTISQPVGKRMAPFYSDIFASHLFVAAVIWYSYKRARTDVLDCIDRACECFNG